ncbi:MAG: hypothetical protein QNJ41_21435 [Xenococcaceae cyanobacterium MO_188.B32]|nr:hypothetical protein [Xenococcaceae cyanobacterium MO_188.B32]
MRTGLYHLEQHQWRTVAIALRVEVTMHKILKKLSGGDRRSIGRADEVVADVCDDPTLFDEVFGGTRLSTFWILVS